MAYATIPIIVVICGIFMSVIKLFTNSSDREQEILAAIIPLIGALIALSLYFLHSDYTLQFEDPIVAIMIGFISGQSALETKSTIEYIKSKKELQDMITEEAEVIKEQTQEIIKEQTQEIIKEQTQEIIKETVNETIINLEDNIV